MFDFITEDTYLTLPPWQERRMQLGLFGAQPVPVTYVRETVNLLYRDPLQPDLFRKPLKGRAQLDLFPHLPRVVRQTQHS
jgi:hypothetical protein